MRGSAGAPELGDLLVVEAGDDVAVVAAAGEQLGVRADTDDPSVVVICVPPDVTARVIEAELAAFPRAVVTDVASVKLEPYRALLERGVDGLMLVGDIHHPDLHARIARHGIPMVQTFSLSRERPCVGFDNAASAARAANYLVDLGHRRIGVISGLRKDNDRGGARVTGIAQALAARGLTLAPEHDIEISYGIGGGRDGFRISFAADEKVLAEALRRIAAALA